MESVGRPTDLNSPNNIVEELDAAIYKSPWSFSIVGAMERIQKQFAIEQNLFDKLHKDYLTDSDRFKFFWSGFANSASPKTFLDVFVKAVLSWETFLLLFLVILVKIWFYDNYADLTSVKYGVFTCSYISIIAYSLYLSAKWRFVVYGDLSSIMMILLLLGRLAFLLMSGTTVSAFLLWGVNFMYEHPNTLYSWCKGIFWALDNIGFISSFAGQDEFFVFASKVILPALKQTGYELFGVFVAFGVLPLICMVVAKTIVGIKKKKEDTEFENG